MDNLYGISFYIIEGGYDDMGVMDLIKETECHFKRYIAGYHGQPLIILGGGVCCERDNSLFNCAWDYKFSCLCR